MKSCFYSWTRQDSLVDFPVASTEHDEFILDDGRRIYDFVSTSFQANFGHSHSGIQQHIARQLADMPMASPKSSFALKESVSNRLNQRIARGPGKLFFTVSGSEAVENALKIARQLTGRSIILARRKSYHGASLGALSVTGDWRNKPHLTFDAGTVRIPEHDEDPDLRKFREIIHSTGADQIAAVVLETIGGTNGMSMPNIEWFKALQTICRDEGILLILDEVLVGFGRCKTEFAFHQYDLQPDIVCLSKAISGGYFPFGAVWTSPAIAQFYHTEVLCCGLTHYAHPLGLAALEAVMDTLDDEAFQNHKQQLESMFAERLAALRQRSVVQEVRICGLLAAVFLDRPAPGWQAAFERGLHLFSKENFLMLAPPFVSHGNRLFQAIDALESLLDESQ